MQELPDKLTFGVAEVARLIGVSPSTVYDLVARGDLKAATAGSKKLITRQALTEFLGLSDVYEGGSTATSKKAGKVEEETEEWTYVVTVRRLRKGEKVRVESEVEPPRWRTR